MSVSWVGSPANVQGFDSVPAPQSQKNLQVRVKKNNPTYYIFLSQVPFLLFTFVHNTALLFSSNMSQSDRPVMPDELHVVSLMTLLDAVHTDGVAVCRVTGVTPVGTRILFCLTKVTELQTSSFGASILSKITCKNHALGSWCSLKSCTGTDLCSQPFQWHLDCSLFCYLVQRRQRGVSDVSGIVHFKKY